MNGSIDVFTRQKQLHSLIISLSKIRDTTFVATAKEGTCLGCEMVFGIKTMFTTRTCSSAVNCLSIRRINWQRLITQSQDDQLAEQTFKHMMKKLRSKLLSDFKTKFLKPYFRMKERTLKKKNNISNFKELFKVYQLKVSPGSVENQMEALRSNILDLTTDRPPRQIDESEELKWQLKSILRKVKQ